MYLDRETKLLIRTKKEGIRFLKIRPKKLKINEVIIFKTWMKIIYHLKVIQITNQM